MSNLITQQDVDKLLTLEKHYRGSKGFTFPSLGGQLHIPLHSQDNREDFILDVNSSRVKLLKNSFQNRARKTIILARVDIDGAPHRNPDGEEIPCPHMHIYKSDYGDKWAVSLPPEKFGNPDDAWQVLNDFMQFCNITSRPPISRDLFT